MPGSAQHEVHGELDSRACAVKEKRAGEAAGACNPHHMLDEENDDGGGRLAVQGIVWAVLKTLLVDSL